MKRTKLPDRIMPHYTKGEEITNMVTHIAGGVMGIVSVVLCVVFAALSDNTYGVVAGAIFGATMIILYTISSVYHGLKPELMAKRVFQVIDHCSIFVLIAGTITPLSLCTVREANTALGWTIFGIIWGVAILGIVLNAIDLKKYAVFSMICYLAMGWSMLLVSKIIIAGVGMVGMALIFAGGISYTIGAVLYGIGAKKRFAHSVFHVFSVIGSLLHFLCILLYVIMQED